LALIAVALSLSHLISFILFATAEAGIGRVIRGFLQAALFFIIANCIDKKIIEKSLEYLLLSTLTICVFNIFHWRMLDRLDLVGQNQLGFIIPVAFAIVLYRNFSSISFEFGLSSLVLLVACLLSWSKGAWLVVAVLYFYYLLTLIGRNNLLITGQITIIAMFFWLNYDFISGVFGTEISASGSDGSNSNYQRVMTIYAGVVTSIVYPMGIGAAYQEVTHTIINYLNFSNVAVMPDSHNAFLHAFSIGGFVYGLFFVAIIMYILVLSIRLGLSSPVGRLGFSIFLIFVIYGQLNGIVLTHNVSWIILGSVIALLKRS
jgi:hypothetical protein